MEERYPVTDEKSEDVVGEREPPEVGDKGSLLQSFSV